REGRQPIEPIVGPALLNCDILALRESLVLQALAQSVNHMAKWSSRSGAQKADHRYPRLLRARRDRPRSRRAAEQLDERAPPHHSITSSAMARSVSGTVRPSAFAVLRLRISSNLVGCWTGRSAGFSPLRIRPV